MFEILDLTEKRQYKKQVKKLYKSAFPANERPPFYMLWNKALKNKGRIYVAVDDGFVGFTHVIAGSDVAYVFFLAVKDDERGKGYGSKILNKIKEIYNGKSIVLNIEEIGENYPNNSERIRRKSFYEKCGFRSSGIKTSEMKVRYELLVYGKDIVYSQYADLMRDYTGRLVYSLFFKEVK